MNKRWMFIAVCVIIALLVLCEAGDKGKAKKKSKKDIEKEKKKNAQPTTPAAETKENNDKMKQQTGNRKSKGKREISMTEEDRLRLMGEALFERMDANGKSLPGDGLRGKIELAIAA